MSTWWTLLRSLRFQHIHSWDRSKSSCSLHGFGWEERFYEAGLQRVRCRSQEAKQMDQYKLATRKTLVHWLWGQARLAFHRYFINLSKILHILEDLTYSRPNFWQYLTSAADHWQYSWSRHPTAEVNALIRKIFPSSILTPMQRPSSINPVSQFRRTSTKLRRGQYIPVLFTSTALLMSL